MTSTTGFPNNYWNARFENLAFFPDFFKFYEELTKIDIPPPARSGNVLRDELKELRRKQRCHTERKKRKDDILAERDKISEKYLKALLIAKESHPRTFQLIRAMEEVGLIAAMHFKRKFNRARPNQVDPRIDPMILVPGHPAYPSGHSTQNFLVAHALSEVIGDAAHLTARVFEIARDVAENREWAGVHYSSDTTAGEKLARDLFRIARFVFSALITEAAAEWQNVNTTDCEAREPRKCTCKDKCKCSCPCSHDDDSHKGNGKKEINLVDDEYQGIRNKLKDTFFHTQWHLDNQGQGDGKPGVDIRVLKAWKLLGNQVNHDPEASTPVRVAVLDMAMDLGHDFLWESIDFARAKNLDYPDLPMKPDDLEQQVRALKTNPPAPDEPKRIEYLESFNSVTSAHGTATAGVIVGSRQAGSCPGIAPDAMIVPYRAMTLTERTPLKRRKLAKALLEMFKGGVGSGERVCDALLCPLPFFELPSGKIENDALAFALAFVATKIPVILPTGNDGSSRLSYLTNFSRFERYVKDPSHFEELMNLMGLDRDALSSLMGLERHEDLQGLTDRLKEEAAFITVGACNNKGYRSRYSQYGDNLLVVAPSDDIPKLKNGFEDEQEDKPEDKTRGTLSISTTDLPGVFGFSQDKSRLTLSHNEFDQFGGTSAAAASVAGVVALMLQADRSLTPTKVREILALTAQVDVLHRDNGKQPIKGSDEFGYGLVDAGAAVEYVINRRKNGGLERIFSSDNP